MARQIHQFLLINKLKNLQRPWWKSHRSVELKDAFSGVNLQFSEYCQVLFLSASTWQRTGFNPKSKATSIVRAQFSLQPQAFNCLPSFHAICARSFPWQGAVWSSPGLGSAWSTGREAELSACKQKLCVTSWELLASSDEDDSNSTSCDYCWENIIWRTEWATSTPIPSYCACFRVPLAVYEAKSAVACCRSSSLALCDCEFLKSPGRFHHHRQDLGWGWLGKDWQMPGTKRLCDWQDSLGVCPKQHN